MDTSSSLLKTLAVGGAVLGRFFSGVLSMVKWSRHPVVSMAYGFIASRFLTSTVGVGLVVSVTLRGGFIASHSGPVTLRGEHGLWVYCVSLPDEHGMCGLPT